MLKLALSVLKIFTFAKTHEYEAEKIRNLQQPGNSAGARHGYVTQKTAMTWGFVLVRLRAFGVRGVQKDIDKHLYYELKCFLRNGRLAQLVEHPLDVRRVSGSSPLSSTK